MRSGKGFRCAAIWYRLRCWLGSERRSVRIQVVLPSNPHLPEFEHVVIFNLMHRVYNIVRDHALQFADETLKDRHLFAGEKSRVRYVKDVARDRVKVLVDAGESLISFQFAGKMVSSQVASNTGDLVRDALLLQQRRVSFFICTAVQDSAQEGCRESAGGVYVQTGEFLCRSRFMCKAA